MGGSKPQSKAAAEAKPSELSIVHPLRIDRDADNYIAGSNSKILSSNLSKTLTGRYMEIPVYPLSLGEFMELNDIDDPRKALEAYMRRGSLPVISKDYTDDDAREMLTGVFNSILFKDIVGDGTVRGPVLRRTS
jgi:predicted AAA+ superfamily ATPase